MSSREAKIDSRKAEQELLARLKELESSPNEPDLCRRVGDLLYVLGRYREAIPHYRRAVTLQPENPSVWHALGIATSNVDDLPTAKDALQKAIALGSDSGNLRAVLASVYQRLHDPIRALNEANQALALAVDPAWVGMVHGVIGGCLSELGKDDLAIEHLEKAIQDNPQNGPSLYNLGRIMTLRGDSVDGLGYLERAASSIADRPEVWYYLGQAAKAAGDLPRAREAFERVIALGWEHETVRGQLAKVLCDLGDARSAISHARKALQLSEDPELQSWLHSLLADCYEDLGDPNARRQHLKKVVALAPGNADAWHDLGVEYVRLSQFSTAVPHLQKATSLCPQDPGAWFTLGYAASRADQLSLAREALETALRLGHEELPARTELVYVLLALGDVDSVLANASAALQLGPESTTRSWLHKTLAQCYGQLGQADRVIEHLQRAIELTPEDADAHYNLGLEYQAQNRSADAIALLRKAVDLAPGDDEYRLAFGRICAESGQYALAEPLLQQLLGTREHDSAHILLVQCWLLQGRTKDAEDLATRAVCERPGSAVALVALSVVLRETRRLMESAEALERARGIDPANAWVQWALEESHNA